MDTPDILGKSLCNNCAHKIVRVISTEGLPIFDEEAGDFIATFVVEDDATDFEQYSCSVLCIDLDHIVLDCNKFEEKEINTKVGLFVNSEVLDELL